MWRTPLLSLYVAMKLPLVLLLTSILTMTFNWMVAVAFGLRIAFLKVCALTLLCLTVAALVLAALAPISWFISVSAPDPTPDARTTHNVLYLFHLLFVGGSGVLGSRTLWSALRQVAPGLGTARRIYVAWVLTFALVGGEVAWAMRPFVGSVFFEVQFLRPDALKGNVYEFILTDILPHFRRELERRTP
jgi:hypothetical protein